MGNLLVKNVIYRLVPAEDVDYDRANPVEKELESVSMVLALICQKYLWSRFRQFKPNNRGHAYKFPQRSCAHNSTSITLLQFFVYRGRSATGTRAMDIEKFASSTVAIYALFVAVFWQKLIS